MSPDMIGYLTPADVAERWRCHPSTVRTLIRGGELPAWKLGTEYRVSLAAVESYETLHRTAAPSIEEPEPEAPKLTTFTPGGWELPADYEPRFPALWGLPTRPADSSPARRSGSAGNRRRLRTAIQSR